MGWVKLATNYQLSITGDTYMSGNLGINVVPGSYTLDILGNARIDGEVGIGAGPSAGVKLYVSGTTIRRLSRHRCCSSYIVCP